MICVHSLKFYGMPVTLIRPTFIRIGISIVNWVDIIAYTRMHYYTAKNALIICITQPKAKHNAINLTNNKQCSNGNFAGHCSIGEDYSALIESWIWQLCSIYIQHHCISWSRLDLWAIMQDLEPVNAGLIIAKNEWYKK